MVEQFKSNPLVKWGILTICPSGTAEFPKPTHALVNDPAKSAMACGLLTN